MTRPWLWAAAESLGAYFAYGLKRSAQYELICCGEAAAPVVLAMAPCNADASVGTRRLRGDIGRGLRYRRA